MTRCRFVPPYLAARVAAATTTAARSDQTLVLDQALRSARRTTVPAVTPTAGPFVIRTADHGTVLPGEVVRGAGQEPVGDLAVDEAHAGVEGTLALFAEAFGRASYDGAGAPVSATVHYGRDYDNAFWDGTQLVFGDGDGRVFDRFTTPVDVLAHEFTHGVTQYAAGLEYSGMPGALNESMSDVFASCLKQRLRAQMVDEADWLIGEGIFLPAISGRALRSMSEPGTAYDDPLIGTDPQGGSMADYVRTSEDNGGVHLNSGIPNRAFHLAAVALGGRSWELPGRIWYAALTSGLDPRSDFSTFADATVAAARAVSPQAAAAVTGAWDEVGVGTSPAASPPPLPDGSGSVGSMGSDRVAVTRTGGVAGVRRTGEVRLGEDPRTGEVTRLLSRIDLPAAASSPPQPDRFVYSFSVRERIVVVGEESLTDDLQALVRLLLED